VTHLQVAQKLNLNIIHNLTQNLPDKTIDNK
jgi:hypothetical protein